MLFYLEPKRYLANVRVGSPGAFGFAGQNRVEKKKELCIKYANIALNFGWRRVDVKSLKY